MQPSRFEADKGAGAVRAYISKAVHGRHGLTEEGRQVMYKAPPPITSYDRIQIDRLLFIRQNLYHHLAVYRVQERENRRLLSKKKREEKDRINMKDVKRVQQSIREIEAKLADYYHGNTTTKPL